MGPRFYTRRSAPFESNQSPPTRNRDQRGRFTSSLAPPLGQLLVAPEPNQSPPYVPPPMRRFDFDTPTRDRDQRGRLGQLLAAPEPDQSPPYVPPTMRRFDFATPTRDRDQRGRFVAAASPPPPSPPPPPPLPPPPPSIKAVKRAAKRARKAEYDEDPLYFAPYGSYEQDQYDAYVSYKEENRKGARSHE